MYPRFLQVILNVNTRNRAHQGATPHTAKVFASMKYQYTGVHRPLTAAMLAIANEVAA